MLDGWWARCCFSIFIEHSVRPFHPPATPSTPPGISTTVCFPPSYGLIYAGNSFSTPQSSAPPIQQFTYPADPFVENNRSCRALCHIYRGRGHPMPAGDVHGLGRADAACAVPGGDFGPLCAGGFPGYGMGRLCFWLSQMGAAGWIGVGLWIWMVGRWSLCVRYWEMEGFLQAVDGHL